MKRNFYHLIVIRGTIIVFLLLVCLPLVQMNFNIIHIKALNENRLKNPLPKLTYQGLKDSNYMKQFEKFFNDHYGFRDLFLRLNSFVDLRIFHVSSQTDVIIGKNDFLFYTPEYNDYLKQQTLTDSQLNDIAGKIARFQNNLNAKGIDFLFVIGPNKSTIYPEYMPDQRSGKNGASNYDKLTKLFDGQKISYLNTIPLLQSLKDKYELYYKRDTHWNMVSGIFVSQEILKYLTNKHPLNSLPKVTSFSKEIKNGDLNNMLGITFKTENPMPVVDFGDISVKLPKIVWPRDSFSNALLPYISPYSSELVEFHFGKGPSSLKVFPCFTGTKIVIFELVERSIPNLVTYDFDNLYNLITRNM